MVLTKTWDVLILRFARISTASRWRISGAAVLLVFGFVFAQSQAAGGHAPSLKSRQTCAHGPQNSSLPNGYRISSNALNVLAGFTVQWERTFFRIQRKSFEPLRGRKARLKEVRHRG
jgi:hypothetical protein